MLDAMRKNTKTILWVTVIAFVLLIFFAWGMEFQSGGGGGAPQGVIARVNGQEIKIDYFNRVYQSARENFRTSRGTDPGPGDEAQMLEQTWNGILEQTLLGQEAKRNGFTPTDQEVVETARNNPPEVFRQNPSFQTNGQFDLQKYQAILANPDIDPQFFVQLENYLREMMPIERLSAMVYSSARVSDPEIKQAFQERNDQARATYRLFELRGYTPTDSVTDAAAEAYYKAHPEEFNLPPQATVAYTKLDRKPTDADVAQIREQLVDYAGIARRAVTGDSSSMSFSMLAETYSELPSATAGGLTDHFYGKGELSPQLEAAVFSLPLGGISDPIQDRAGFHIVQVDSIKTEGDATKIRIRDLMLKVEPSPGTVTELEDKMQALKDQADKGQFEAAAKAAGLTVTNPPPFTENGYIRGMETVPGVVEWAFKAPVGSLSHIVATNDAWYLLNLVSRTDKGTPPFQQVTALARQKALEAKQREMARKDAEAFLARVRGVASWRAAAGPDSNQVRLVGPFSRASGFPGLGREPEALAAIFAMSPGQVGGPIDVSRGVIVFRVEERKPADESQFATQKAQIGQQLMSQKRTEVYQDWLKQLKARAQIKDYRDLYFRS